MKNVELSRMVGGAVQETFKKSMDKVLDNLMDVNTPYKAKRSITIKIDFEQNEVRNNVKAKVSVVEKLAPLGALETEFAIGKDLETGETYMEEWGKQIRGQMNLNDYPEVILPNGDVVSTDTGEVVEKKEIVNFRKEAKKAEG